MSKKQVDLQLNEINKITPIDCKTYDQKTKHRLDVLWSSRSDEWETPWDIFNDLNKELGPFTLDVSAQPGNTKVPQNYFTQEENGLLQDWRQNICWMNPPYSEVGKWIRKAYHESRKPGTTVVCLVAARTDTRWFHKYCVHGEVWFIKGRLVFENAENPAPFPSMIVIFREGSP